MERVEWMREWRGRLRQRSIRRFRRALAGRWGCIVVVLSVRFASRRWVGVVLVWELWARRSLSCSLRDPWCKIRMDGNFWSVVS